MDGWLEAVTESKRANALRVSTTAGAKAAVPILRAATPVGADGQSASASVQMKAMRKSYGIGSVVAPMTRKGKKAQHRHLVEYGTKAHIIAGKEGGFLRIGNRYLRAVRHPGARPRHFMEGAAGSMSAAAEGAFEVRMVRYMESGRPPTD